MAAIHWKNRGMAMAGKVAPLNSSIAMIITALISAISLRGARIRTIAARLQMPNMFRRLRHKTAHQEPFMGSVKYVCINQMQTSSVMVATTVPIRLYTSGCTVSFSSLRMASTTNRYAASCTMLAMVQGST